MERYIKNSVVFLFVYFMADFILSYDFYMVYTDILLLVFMSLFFTVVLVSKVCKPKAFVIPVKFS